jgi:hypothetical protein
MRAQLDQLQVDCTPAVNRHALHHLSALNLHAGVLQLMQAALACVGVTLLQQLHMPGNTSGDSHMGHVFLRSIHSYKQGRW